MHSRIALCQHLSEPISVVQAVKLPQSARQPALEWPCELNMLNPRHLQLGML